jgi:hypothetical protein
MGTAGWAGNCNQDIRTGGGNMERRLKKASVEENMTDIV